ncbi:MAG: hypothetical protein WCD70_12340 [Alphaproteobacteria bacterium]
MTAYNDLGWFLPSTAKVDQRQPYSVYEGTPKGYDHQEAVSRAYTAFCNTEKFSVSWAREALSNPQEKIESWAAGNGREGFEHTLAQVAFLSRSLARHVSSEDEERRLANTASLALERLHKVDPVNATEITERLTVLEPNVEMSKIFAEEMKGLQKRLSLTADEALKQQVSTTAAIVGGSPVDNPGNGTPHRPAASAQQPSCGTANSRS